MDSNEFSFNALFRCPNFIWYDSVKLEEEAHNVTKLLTDNLEDNEFFDKITTAIDKYNSVAQENGFEQGFHFAVKLMRKLYDMSFPEMPPLL